MPDKKIILPGLIETEFLPEIVADPQVHEFLENLLYSGKFELCMRDAGCSDRLIQKYRDAVARRNTEVAGNAKSN